MTSHFVRSLFCQENFCSSNIPGNIIDASLETERMCLIPELGCLLALSLISMLAAEAPICWWCHKNMCRPKSFITNYLEPLREWKRALFKLWFICRFADTSSECRAAIEWLSMEKGVELAWAMLTSQNLTYWEALMIFQFPSPPCATTNSGSPHRSARGLAN